MSEPRRDRRVEPTASQAPMPIRASDAEREQVAEIVRRAVGDGRLTLVEGDERLAGIYATVHRGDLVPFTADLGETAGSTPRPAVVEGRPTRGPFRPVALGGADWTPGGRHTLVALMTGGRLRLRHTRGRGEGLPVTAVALMGGAVIDARGADLREGLTVRAYAMMGGIEVVVDPDTRVEEHGIGMMGSFTDASGAPTRPDAPVVRVTGVALMGGVTVRRRRTGTDADGRPERGDDHRGPHGLHGGH